MLIEETFAPKRKLYLLTPHEYDQLPAGTRIWSVNNHWIVKGLDKRPDHYLWDKTHMAYGLEAKNLKREGEIVERLVLAWLLTI